MNQHISTYTKDGNTYYYLPSQIDLPIENSKYATVTWKKWYNIRLLAHQIYGDKNMVWLLLACNNITSPWAIKTSNSFKFLLPKYINEVEIKA